MRVPGALGVFQKGFKGNFREFQGISGLFESIKLGTELQEAP